MRNRMDTFAMQLKFGLYRTLSELQSQTKIIQLYEFHAL